MLRKLKTMKVPHTPTPTQIYIIYDMIGTDVAFLNPLNRKKKLSDIDDVYFGAADIRVQWVNLILG